MNRPFMPKAVALWLLRHTKLTHQQIADFCKLYIHEIDNLVYNHTLSEKNPIAARYISEDDIKKCENDPDSILSMHNDNLINCIDTKYTYMNKKSKKLNCIAWICKYYPQAKNAHIVKLLGTTPQTINKVRTLTNIEEEHPVTTGICSKYAFDLFVSQYANTQTNHDPFEI